MSNEARPKKKRRGGPRRRTGCNTCKGRHTRCDEQKPVCGNCERLDLDCEQSEDSTWMIMHADSTQQHVNLDAPSLLDVFRSQMSGLDGSGEDAPSSHAPGPSGLTSPSTRTDSNTSADAISLTPESAFLLQTYVRTVATWMDCFDHLSTYQLKVPQLVLKSPLLFHCVCAFVSNHLALSNPSQGSSWKIVAVKHYGEALNLLIDALSIPSHEHALTASMLLLSYEIHGAQRSEDYRRHFLGLAMLIKARGITAQSTGTDLANFWIFIRHDIVASMASEKPLILDPADWAVCWQDNETREDVLGNQVLWILARVLNLIFGKDGTTEAGKAQRHEFLRELEIWRAGLSETFVGIPYGEEDEYGFRRVYFPVLAAAAAAFWYHIVHILLYAEPNLQDETYIPLIQDQAMHVTNIALSDFPPALKVFSSHGLFYAAKHIRGISRKARVWSILSDVEAHTGYNTRTTVRLLQALVEQKGAG